MPDLSASLRELVEGSVHTLDVDAIVRKRRRRRRQRRAGSAVVVVVIAALVTGGVLARPVHEPQVTVRGSSGVTRVSEADATRAALAGLTIMSPGGGSSSEGGGVGPVNLTDPRSGATRQVAFPIGRVTSTNYPFLVRGSNVVMSLNTIRGPYDASIGTVYVASSTLDQWRAVGSASYMVPSVDPDRVWLVSDNSTPDQRLNGTEYGSVRTVVEESLDGNYRSEAYPLTGLRTPLGAVAGGLLTARSAAAESAPPIIEVWNPVTDRVVRRLAVAGDVVASSTSYVAWTDRDCDSLQACALHLTDARTGASRSVMPPRGMLWSPRAEAFSPDGARLALVATPPPTQKELEYRGLVIPPGTRAATVVIVDAATGSESSWRTNTWEGLPAPEWSPDGSLVFVVRDRTHVGYLNVAYPHGPVRDVPAPDAGEYLVAATPAPSTATQRYQYDGLVSQSADHSPELCVFPTAAITLPLGSDGCSGPIVAGWDWSKVTGAKSANGVTSGNFHVVGTYDGHTFALAQPPKAVTSSPPPPVPKFETPCATPPGGWGITNVARLEYVDYSAMTDAARSAPDFAGLWLASSSRTPAGTDDVITKPVNIAFTGAVEAHRRALEALWGGPICVVQRPNRYADLLRIERELFADAGRALGLQVIEAGPDEVHDALHVEVIAATDETRRAIDQRFGRGVVNLESRLRPIP